MAIRRPLVAVDLGVLSLTLFTLRASAETPLSGGWHTIKDSTGVCQMSVPKTWASIPGSDGSVASPEHIMSVLIAGYVRAPAPMTEADRKNFGVDKVIENSSARWLYSTKPVSAQNTVTYHVNVPIAGHVCAAELAVKTGHSEEELRAIAATVKAAK